MFVCLLFNCFCLLLWSLCIITLNLHIYSVTESEILTLQWKSMRLCMTSVAVFIFSSPTPYSDLVGSGTVTEARLCQGCLLCPECESRVIENDQNGWSRNVGNRVLRIFISLMKMFVSFWELAVPSLNITFLSLDWFAWETPIAFLRHSLKMTSFDQLYSLSKVSILFLCSCGTFCIILLWFQCCGIANVGLVLLNSQWYLKLHSAIYLLPWLLCLTSLLAQPYCSSSLRLELELAQVASVCLVNIRFSRL